MSDPLIAQLPLPIGGSGNQSAEQEPQGGDSSSPEASAASAEGANQSGGGEGENPASALIDSAETATDNIGEVAEGEIQAIESYLEDLPFFKEFSGLEIAGNSLIGISAFFLTLFFAYLAAKMVQLFFAVMAKRAEDKGRPLRSAFLRALARGFLFPILVIGLIVGKLFLNLGPAGDLIDKFTAILFSIAIGKQAFELVAVPKAYFATRAASSDNKLDNMLGPIIAKCLYATIVVLVIVQIGQILSGEEIGAIIAGLGIGGLAVALAAQDTFKNFFGTLTIAADKPFKMGERINVDDHDGTVESVGLRSTRVRRLDGHLVTFPNGDLANKPIWNIAKRPFIRRLFNITVTYDTPPEKVEEGKRILESILENHEGMKEDFPPRVFFTDFNDASLGYLVIYWYHPPAYWDYMAYSERVNLEILRRFNEAGIDFAFPTQTLHLAGDPNRPLHLGVEMSEKNGQQSGPGGSDQQP